MTGKTQVTGGGYQRPLDQKPSLPHTVPHSSPGRRSGSPRAFLAKVRTPFRGSRFPRAEPGKGGSERTPAPRGRLPAGALLEQVGRRAPAEGRRARTPALLTAQPGFRAKVGRAGGTGSRGPRGKWEKEGLKKA